MAKPYAWGGEHFCAPDATTLYHAEPQRLHSIGFPVELDANPVPPTFCSVCLLFFDDPAHDAHPTGSGPRPPEQGEHHGTDTQ